MSVRSKGRCFRRSAPACGGAAAGVTGDTWVWQRFGDLLGSSGSLNVSYTLDAFGGIRRQVEQLDAQAEYQRFELEATDLTLAANVINAAITEASVQAQIDTTRDIIKADTEALDLTRRRFQLGGVSEVDVLQQQSLRDTQVATLPGLQKQLQQQRNQLAVYLGGRPDQYATPTLDLGSLHLPEDLPVSLPSKLVEQRPDIRAFGALLHSATAAVGIATANMLPQISLTGGYGREATELSTIFTPGGIVWSIASSLTQPIFEGGTLRARKRAAVAALDVAAAQYSSTVNVAFQNVANALVAIQRDAEALRAALAAQKTSAGSLAVARAQYAAGGGTYLNVLTAEQSDYSARLNSRHRPDDTLHRYRRIVSGARRRLVEPHRYRSEDCTIQRSVAMNDTATLARTTTRRPRTWLRMAVMLLVVGLLAAGVIGFQRFKAGIINQIVTTIKSALPTVATTSASMQDWQATQTAVGSARAFNGADLAAEVAGVVDEIHFESGQTVAAGDVLLRLRPNDDDAKLATASGQRRSRRGDACSATSVSSQAHGVAQATVDTDAANLKVARAQVTAQQAVMAERTIRAPFAGRLGVRQVDLGQFIAAGTTIVTLQQLDPMFVDFICRSRHWADRRRSEGRGDRRCLSQTRLSPGRFPR